MSSFRKVIEDFACAHCGYSVKGNGYTDHCPNCLYSKHVDIAPGDRQNSCQGLMQPIGIEQKNGKFRIVYQCMKCKKRHVVKTTPEDNIKIIVKLAHNPT